MTTTPTQAARVRSLVDHPIIDADGHFVEVGPLLQDEVDQLRRGRRRRRAARAVPRHRARRSTRRRASPTAAIPTVREQWKAMPSWWGWQTANVRDRATSHLPALLYERLDELGIDFTILYPSMALGYFEVDRRRAVVGAVPGGEPLPPARCSSRTAIAARSARMVPMNTPEQADRRGRVRGDASWARSRCSWPGTSRRPVGPTATASTCSASTATTTTTRSGRSAWSSASRRWCTARCSQHRVTRSISNYVYNHINGLAAAHESLCKSLFLGGVTRRFPELRIGFLEGGVAWACALFVVARRALGEAQPRRDRRSSIPTGSTSTRCIAYFAEYGDDDGAPARLDELRDVLRAPGGAARAGRRVRGVRDRRGRRPARRCFEPNFYFGCEADDPLVAWAFRDDVNPLGARLRPILGSDISHWDVPDMTEPVAEAYELVEHGVITDARLPRPHVRQPGAPARRPEPAVLRGHGVRGRGHAGAGRGRGGVAVNRDDARPLRSVVFAPGDDADALGGDARVGRRLDGRRPRGAADAVPRVGARARPQGGAASSSTRWYRASCRSCSRGCSRRRPARR